jgi:hypothetical protein
MLANACVRLSPALAVLLIAACTAQPDPFYVDREEAISENRFLKKIHSPEEVPEEEPPPYDQDNTDEEAGGSGQRHKGEEGKMGKPTSRSKSGLYAMKGPRDYIPQAAGRSKWAPPGPRARPSRSTSTPPATATCAAS